MQARMHTSICTQSPVLQARMQAGKTAELKKNADF